MIPSEKLKIGTPSETEVQFPARTESIVTGCEHDSVRAELCELLSLANTVATEGNVADREAFSELVDEILSSGERLDEALSEVHRHNTAELWAELEKIDDAIDRDEDDAEPLHRRREQALEAIAEHDRSVHEATRLRSALQMARGTLLDLLSEVDEVKQRFLLSYDDYMENELGELAARLEAKAEVETIASPQGGA